MSEEWFETLPEHVWYAFEQAGYDGSPFIEEAIANFANRWGGLDIEVFARVLQKGKGEDRVLAIFAVGFARTQWSRELLIPFLYSTQPQEQWASALCLGRMREEQTVPVLVRMLTAFLPPKEQPGFMGDLLWLYNNWRGEAMLLLADWGRSELVPVWLAALEVFRQMEQTIPEHVSIQARYWRRCQLKVVYALGWLGWLDVLTAFEMPTAVLCSWRVYYVLGVLHAHAVYPDVLDGSGVWTKSELRDQVAVVLQDLFGFSREELERCLSRYQRYDPI